jgi:hypothetical protein
MKNRRKKVPGITEKKDVKSRKNGKKDVKSRKNGKKAQKWPIWPEFGTTFSKKMHSPEI